MKENPNSEKRLGQLDKKNTADHREIQEADSKDDEWTSRWVFKKDSMETSVI